MKIDLKFKIDIYTMFIWIVLAILIMLTYKAVINLQVQQIELNKLIEENKAYVFDYSCDSFDSKFYNCPLNESFRNITGTYCYGKSICENYVRKIK